MCLPSKTTSVLVTFDDKHITASSRFYESEGRPATKDTMSFRRQVTAAPSGLFRSDGRRVPTGLL
jgi:hypothetical protein